MYKFLFATLAMIPLALFSAPPSNFVKAVRHDFPRLFCLAAFGVFAEGFLAMYSLKFTTSARSSLLCNMSPMFTVIVAAWASRRWPRRLVLLGMVIGIVGSYLTFSSQGSDVYAPVARTLPGDILALLSGVAWAYYTVYCTEVGQKYGVLVCSAILMALSTSFLFLWCLVTRTDILIAQPVRVWAGIVYLGVLGTGICVALWNNAALHVPPAALGAFGYLSATIGMVLGFIGLNETLTWRFAVAIVCCMLAVWIMNQFDKQETLKQ